MTIMYSFHRSLHVIVLSRRFAICLDEPRTLLQWISHSRLVLITTHTKLMITLLCLFNRSYSDYLYCFTKSYLLFIRFSHSVYISFKSLYTLPSAAMPLRGGTATISLYHILPCSLSYFTKSLPLCSIWAIDWSKFVDILLISLMLYDQIQMKKDVFCQ